MTTTTTGYTTAARDDERRTSYVTGLATLAAAAAVTSLQAHDRTEFLVVIAVCAAVGAAVYGWLLPRHMPAGAPGSALALGIVAALLVVPAFWSGLPLILGAAAVLLGMASRVRSLGRATTAIVLGALASVAYVAIFVEELVTGKM